MGLRETLGEMPSGRRVTMSMDGVAKYIFDHISSNEEIKRKEKMRKRSDLYYDRGHKYVDAIIDKTFDHKLNKDLRKKFVDQAMLHNITRTIIHLQSTVYSEPAKRRVNERNINYQALLDQVGIDRCMRKANRMMNLHNEVIVWFRVRGDDRKMVCSVVDASSFSVLAHPLDSTRHIATIFPFRVSGKEAVATDPHWTVWSDEERFHLDQMGRFVQGSYVDHGLGMQPGVLIHKELPDNSLLNPDPGEDIIAAHIATAFLYTLLLKEQKSGGKYPYLQGDLAHTAMGQILDTESPTHLGEGVTPGTLDLGSPPGNYIDSIRTILKSVAAANGLNETLLENSYAASSGFEIELRRIPIREKRRDQILDYRPVEKKAAEIMSRLSVKEVPSLSFGMGGWSIDFGEVETPQEPSARLAYLEELRRNGLTNTAEIAKTMNPDFTDKQAAAFIAMNIKFETERIRMMRELQALGASPQSPPTEENPPNVSGVDR